MTKDRARTHHLCAVISVSSFGFHSSFVIRHYPDENAPFHHRARSIAWSAFSRHRRFRRRPSRSSSGHFHFRAPRPIRERHTRGGDLRSAPNEGAPTG